MNDNTAPSLTDDEYINELEEIVIFLCDVYSKGADSLAVQERNNTTDDKWFGIYMTFPTIQGTANRHAVDKIGALRNIRGNRIAPKISLPDLYARLKLGRGSRL